MMKPRNLSNSSSRQIISTLDLVDRISALPDSILSRILSLLPTKNAVATTILSKRWKFMWTTVHNLDFCYMDFMADEEVDEDDAEHSKFARFVDHVLLLHDGGFLNKFRLVWKPWFIPSQVISWLNTAITRNVHKIVLCVVPFLEFSIMPLEMPVSVFSCGSLQHLELNGTILVSSAIVVCLPRLESLILVSVYFHSEEAFQKLICGCPVLNYLEIDMNNADTDTHETITYSLEKDNFKYIISSTSLRLLVVDFAYSEDCTRRLQLEASSLEYLKVDGHIPQVFVQGSLSSLVEADFGIQLNYGDDYDSIVEPVCAFDCAKTLTLCGDAMWALSNATISLSTKFRSLTKLETGAVCCYCSSLLDFIQCSDSLEDLTIYKVSIEVEEYDSDHYVHDHSNWIAPLEVPRCLANSLKKVSLKGFGGFDDERKMIGYMLRHGSVLEVMQVKYKRDGVHFGLVEELYQLPRKSPACKVELIGVASRRINRTLDLVDRISALPDSILSRILSHLPTKNAVATTILSKRWKFMWMTVHNLDFMEDEEYEDEDEDSKFAGFVNHVLLLHDGGLLNKFRLVWKHWFIPSQIIPWINTAIKRNVHELVLCVEGPREEFSCKPLEMPLSVFSCGSLQSLELIGTISVSSSIVVRLPRLESLKLVSVSFHSEEAFQKLICGCPMLNYLYIQMDELYMDDYHMITYPGESEDFKYMIFSTSLRRLVVDVGYSNLGCTRSLELEASSLEYLKLNGYIPIHQGFVQGTLSSLVKADFGGIQLCYGYYDLVVEAVRAFDCARALTLSCDAMWALSNATISLSTKFSRLTKLEAKAVCCYCSSLLDFIQCSDSLEDLTICRHIDSVDVDEYVHDHSNWTAPVEVPRCLSNSLKKVSLKGYGGFDDEREMVGYMLRHGSVLEVMQMMKYDMNDMNSWLVEEISRFPRNSPACKVEFISPNLFTM